MLPLYLHWIYQLLIRFYCQPATQLTPLLAIPVNSDNEAKLQGLQSYVNKSVKQGSHRSRKVNVKKCTCNLCSSLGIQAKEPSA